jgi:hypothetical protein
MTAAELAGYQIHAYGRNYAESDDGYSDMAAEEKRGWRVLFGWGRDGWDLAEWPYVMIYVREFPAAGAIYGLMSICEGDRTVYAFASQADRDAALDYLFLWYAAGRRWAPLSYEQRAELDAGTLEVAAKWRGPYRETSAAERETAGGSR